MIISLLTSYSQVRISLYVRVNIICYEILSISYADDGSEHSITPNKLLFVRCTREASVDVEIVDDCNLEKDEYYRMTLRGPSDEPRILSGEDGTSYIKIPENDGTCIMYLN